tara:strand:- start:109 stop:456 length:348 start_codon:yes stop_codon:yes gene_type:complete
MKPAKKITTRNIKKIRRDTVNSYNNHGINTQEIVDNIYRHVTNELQKELSQKIYNCITKQLHNELIQFKNCTEKYLNKKISNEFNLIKRDLTLILNNDEEKDMELDKEDIPSYYS